MNNTIVYDTHKGSNSSADWSVYELSILSEFKMRQSTLEYIPKYAYLRKLHSYFDT